MRPRLALTLGTAATIVFVAGCSFLISFDDVPDPNGIGDDDDDVDAGRKKPGTSTSSSGETSSSSSSSSGETSSSSSSSSSSGAANVIPPPCDEAFDRNAINCQTGSANYTRPNCGSEPGLLQGAAKESDLIDCTGGTTPICVRHCPHGCAEMPLGFNDSCDECFDKADGFYCTKDLKGDWAGPNNGMAIRCQGGVKVENAPCGQDKCATVCPTPIEINAARPSCCIP